MRQFPDGQKKHDMQKCLERHKLLPEAERCTDHRVSVVF